MFKGSTRARVHVELASPTYLGLGIIKVIILPCLYFCQAPVYAWSFYPQPTFGLELCQ